MVVVVAVLIKRNKRQRNDGDRGQPIVIVAMARGSTVRSIPVVIVFLDIDDGTVPVGRLVIVVVVLVVVVQVLGIVPIPAIEVAIISDGAVVAVAVAVVVERAIASQVPVVVGRVKVAV